LKDMRGIWITSFACRPGKSPYAVKSFGPTRERVIGASLPCIPIEPNPSTKQQSFIRA